MLGYYIPIKNQPYLTMFPFEEIDLPSWRTWFTSNWSISLYIGALYITFIVVGQRLMRNRKGFDLRLQLAMWNFAMASFSAIGFSRFFPELGYILFSKDGGLYKAACVIDNHGMSMACWALIYALSKAVQLGDTVFIVLRKRKLIILHWYHHASVMILSWYTYQAYIPLLRFVGSMNYFVHIFMYSYYGLKAMEFKVPKLFGTFVTVLELMQMLAGLYVTLFIVYEHNYGDRPCLISTRAIGACSVIYSTLFFLFGKHFMKTVLRKRKTE